MSPTNIQWTDETWNPVVGCTKVSQGCKNCYAKAVHDNRHGFNERQARAAGFAGAVEARAAGAFEAKGEGGYVLASQPAQYDVPFETVQLLPERLTKPLHWRTPRLVFVNSVSDLFHEDVPFEFIDRVFAVMALCPQHTFQVLTKRGKRMREYLAGDDWGYDRRLDAIGEAMEAITGRPVSGDPADDSYDILEDLPLPNVWLGVSVEDQAAADTRIPELLATPAAVRFLSCEPLLGPVNLRYAGWPPRGRHGEREWSEYDDQIPIRAGEFDGLDWVIFGGESGAHARPCNIDWIRDGVRQCQAAGVPVFVKQLGSKPYFETTTTWNDRQVPVKEVLRLKHGHGGDIAEWPADLCIRESPAVPR